MNSKAAFTWSWFLVAVPLLIGLYYYPHLPDQMVSHWNMVGVPDGSVPTFWGVVTLPLISAALIGLFALIPHIDPLSKNIAMFRREYNTFVVVLLLAIGVIQTALIAFNLGVQFDMSDVVLPTLGVLFFVIGTILPYTKRNWFFGIRTPWTINSDTVWAKTHRAGGVLFQLLGVLFVLDLFLPANYEQFMPFVLFAPLAAVVIGLVIYSYVLFRHTEPATTPILPEEGV